MGKSRCDGCRFSRLGVKNLCVFRYNHKIKNCPCTVCLVKVTCSKGCDERPAAGALLKPVKFSYWSKREGLDDSL